MTLRTKRAAVLGLLILPALAILAAAQPAPDGNARPDWDPNARGRYSMLPIDGGVMRLDRETGGVAICARVDNELACRAIEDRTNVPQADELAALRAENRQLKQRIREMTAAIESGDLKPSTPDGSGPRGQTPGEPNAGPPGENLQLPTDAEMDQALDYLSRVYKKIRDHVRDLDKDSSPPGQPPLLRQPPSAQPPAAQPPAAQSPAPATPPPKLSP
ncbi:hypothetical protein [Hyphomicrobium sp. 2TAF46]|uniref:hypothetical protein n=1 Tax=Hyphomicrobium sp. 2TAF46 TaxID=3233019 RepID=UPI003F8F28CE